jgi:hypothetical protein
LEDSVGWLLLRLWLPLATASARQEQQQRGLQNCCFGHRFPSSELVMIGSRLDQYSVMICELAEEGEYTHPFFNCSRPGGRPSDTKPRSFKLRKATITPKHPWPAKTCRC